MQDERWKLIVGKSPALYDLSSDPEEQHNVVALHPLQVKRLGEEIGAREDVLRATATQHETIVEQLRAIGYIEE